MLAFLFGKKTRLKIRRENLILKSRIILPSLALGLSSFIMQASESVIFVCFNSSLLKYGGDIAVGAMTILTSVMQFAMLPLQGLGQGAQPIISYNYGARNADRVRAAFKILLKVSLGYSITLWALIMLFPQGFAAMFTDTPALIEFTKTALRIYAACLLLFGIQIACQMTFTSLGNAKASILVAVMRQIHSPHSADLYSAGHFHAGADNGGIRRGAGCGFSGRVFHRRAVHLPVQKVPGRTAGRRRDGAGAPGGKYAARFAVTLRRRL